MTDHHKRQALLIQCGTIAASLALGGTVVVEAASDPVIRLWIESIQDQHSDSRDPEFTAAPLVPSDACIAYQEPCPSSGGEIAPKPPNAIPNFYKLWTYQLKSDNSCFQHNVDGLSQWKLVAQGPAHTKPELVTTLEQKGVAWALEGQSSWNACVFAKTGPITPEPGGCFVEVPCSDEAPR